MKGFSIQGGTEYRITVAGERWNQGDSLSIEIGTASAAPVFVAIAEGTDKKIRAKSEDSFEILESREGDGPGFKTVFTLAGNARITDKSGSLYLLYGNPGAKETLANLKLSIAPHPVFLDVCDLMTGHFRFALKNTAMGKSGRVEFKFEPSGAKEWASLSHLFLRIRTENDSIELELLFHRTVINALKPGLAAEKTSRSFQRTIPTGDIVHGFNGRLNSEAAKAVLESIFSEYREQSWLPA